MSQQEQFALFSDVYEGTGIISSRADCAWKIEGSFTNLTVTPSIDTPSHWHGHITNGEVRDAQ